MIDSHGEPTRDRDDALCDELLSYLRTSPDAMDTLEGIAEWWLPRHRIRTAVESISRALESLAQRELVERVTQGGRVMYRLRAAHDSPPSFPR